MQLSSFSILLLLCALALASAQTTSPATSSAASPASSPNAALITTLKTAPSQVDRVKALGDNFIFDFRGTLGVSEGRGGKTVAATARTFPALIGNGVAMTVGYLGPCGINLPHTHPRATEFNFVASGAFEAGFFMENGNEFVMTNVTQGMAVVFPQGAIHFEQNMNCEPAVFVAGFNNEDPGVSTIATNFFGLPTAIVGASLGGLNISSVEDLRAMLPTNPALGTEECRRRCGLSLD